jgi:Peptidase propeptide and YPEB domain
MKNAVIALAVATSWTFLDLWAQQSETDLLKQARVTKHEAKKIALAKVRRGAIKCVALEKENGVLIWSVDIAQPPKKDLIDVWVDATTGRITAIEVETPLTEKKEVAEQKAKKWLSHQNAY